MTVLEDMAIDRGDEVDVSTEVRLAILGRNKTRQKVIMSRTSRGKFSKDLHIVIDNEEICQEVTNGRIYNSRQRDGRCSGTN